MKNQAVKSKTEQGKNSKTRDYLGKAPIPASGWVKDGPAKAPKEDPKVAWAKERIKALDARLGVSVGAKRERERLNSILNPKS